ncbi:MAG: ABC transporter ATP-binding protein [Bacilli bacterium]|nr:ABC transporter ATP-binding protein [Bacilli bacterium]
MENIVQQDISIRFENITKTFGSVIANEKITFDIYKGEILSLLGENGSGKTTLMNMLSGIYFPDEGQIYINGKKVTIASPMDAFKLKIGMVHQHFKLIDVFTCLENIVLGITNKEKANKNNARKAVKDLCDRYGFEINLDKKVYDLSVSEKQTLEILKTLYREAEILILDEPTAVLTPIEIRKLFSVLSNMRKDGKTIIIITHKLNEVMEISDRVAVLRKGQYVDTVKTSQTSEAQLTEMMVGKKIVLDIDRTEPKNMEDRLFVEHLTVMDKDGAKVIDDINFIARSGEILGIAGIAGSGQRELLEAIAGLKPVSKGNIIFNRPKKNLPVSFFHKTYREVVNMAKKGAFHYENGKPVDFTGMSSKKIKELVNAEKIIFNENEIYNLRNLNPRTIRELGVRLSFVPEDRLGMGLVGNMDLVDNMMLRSYRKGKGIVVNRKKPEALAEEIVHELDVVTPNLHTPVRKLSGGNVQKVLVGREISSSPKVLMAAYPVRGLDINSSYLIYNLLDKEKQEGSAVIFVGEDLDVLLALCDRILVMCEGKVSGIVDARTTTKEEVGLLMTKKNEDEEETGGEENVQE